MITITFNPDTHVLVPKRANKDIYLAMRLARKISPSLEYIWHCAIAAAPVAPEVGQQDGVPTPDQIAAAKDGHIAWRFPSTAKAAPRDIRNAAGELVAIARKSCEPATPPIVQQGEPETFNTWFAREYGHPGDMPKGEWKMAQIGFTAGLKASPQPQQGAVDLKAWLSRLEDESPKLSGMQLFTRVRTYLQATGYLAATPSPAVDAALEEAARIAETPVSGEQDDITMEAKDRISAAIRALKANKGASHG